MMRKKLIGTVIALMIASISSVSAVNYCECGIYAGVQAGWAKIESPTDNDCHKNLHGIRRRDISDSQGGFSWGANVGYNYPVYPEMLVSFEAGYHDNGCSSITFKNGNEYRMDTTDWELLATATYIWCPGLWFNVKWGAARVRNEYRIFHMAENCDLDPTSITKKWAPTTALGLGYNFCGFDIYIMYRYIFGSDLTRMSRAFSVRGEAEEFSGTFKLRDRAPRVHGIYAGIQASLY